MCILFTKMYSLLHDYKEKLETCTIKSEKKFLKTLTNKILLNGPS